jgi:hypothetical protein
LGAAVAGAAWKVVDLAADDLADRRLEYGWHNWLLVDMLEQLPVLVNPQGAQQR